MSVCLEPEHDGGVWNLELVESSEAVNSKGHSLKQIRDANKARPFLGLKTAPLKTGLNGNDSNRLLDSLALVEAKNATRSCVSCFSEKAPDVGFPYSFRGVPSLRAPGTAEQPHVQ